MRCLCARLRCCERLLTSYYENELRAAGLTPSQFELLATIAQNRSIGQMELAAQLGVDQTTLSRNMRIPLQRKWIVRTLSADDQRRVVYTLSDTGGKAWRAALPHWRRAHAHMRRLLAGDWETVWTAMEKLNSVTPGRA